MCSNSHQIGGSRAERPRAAEAPNRGRLSCLPRRGKAFLRKLRGMTWFNATTLNFPLKLLLREGRCSSLGRSVRRRAFIASSAGSQGLTVGIPQYTKRSVLSSLSFCVGSKNSARATTEEIAAELQAKEPSVREQEVRRLKAFPVKYRRVHFASYRELSRLQNLREKQRGTTKLGAEIASDSARSSLPSQAYS
jgi:hypothetical protein